MTRNCSHVSEWASVVDELIPPAYEECTPFGGGAPTAVEAAKQLYSRQQQPPIPMSRNRSRVAEWAALLDERVPQEYERPGRSERRE